MERQARGIALVCGPWGLSLFCAPWAKFTRVAVRENSSRVHLPAGSHFQLNAKEPESPYLVECAVLILSRHSCGGEGGVLKKRRD